MNRGARRKVAARKKVGVFFMGEKWGVYTIYEKKMDYSGAGVLECGKAIRCRGNGEDRLHKVQP